MNVFIASDLHLQGNRPGGDRSLMKLADYVCRYGSSRDVLMLLGDYGNSQKSIRDCLSLFNPFRGKRLAVIGNHDLWERSRVPETINRYRLIQEIIESTGFHALDRAPLVIGDFAFVGNIGWYDYSFRDLADVPIEAYETKTIPGAKLACWFDACYVNWSDSDSEVTAQMTGSLKKQLGRLNGEKVIVGMHHVPTKKLLFHPRSMVPYEWRFANCFLGSNQFAELFSQARERIDHVFCGHIHRFKSLRDGGVRYTSVGSDYDRKQLLVYDPIDKKIIKKKF